MVKIMGLGVDVPRGDTGDFSIVLSGDDLDFGEGSAAYVSLNRKPWKEEEPIWSKSVELQKTGDGEYTLDVELSSLETDYACGDYWWDLRIVNQAGDVYAPFAPQRFTIMSVCGNWRSMSASALVGGK